MARTHAVRDVLVLRHKMPLALALVGVLGAASLLGLGVAMALGLDLTDVRSGYSSGYEKAAGAAIMAKAVWAALTFIAGARLLGHCMRRAAGLPEPPRPAWLRGLLVSISIVALFMLLKMLVNGPELRFHSSDGPTRALVLALVVWASFSAAVPWMTWSAITLLRTRVASLRVRAAPLIDLASVTSGRVRISGRVADSAELQADELVYRDDLRQPEKEALVRPFMLEDGGHRAWIDASPSALDVVADPNRRGNDAERTVSVVGIGVGDAISVIGEVQTGTTPYRGGLPRVAAPADGPLVILSGDSKRNRRLMVGAVIELASAAALAGAALLLVVVRLAIG